MLRPEGCGTRSVNVQAVNCLTRSSCRPREMWRPLGVIPIFRALTASADRERIRSGRVELFRAGHECYLEMQPGFGRDARPRDPHTFQAATLGYRDRQD